jgi:serine/threonine protein kinase
LAIWRFGDLAIWSRAAREIPISNREITNREIAKLPDRQFPFRVSIPLLASRAPIGYLLRSLATIRDDPSSYSPPAAFGPFRVLHQIGAGVLGPVYRTYEPERDRLVAVKVFKLDITPEQARGLAEALARIAARSLSHPGLVTPIAADVEGTVAYLAEEYVAAESLDVAMRHYAPAPPAKVQVVIRQLVGAFDLMREAGVLHGVLHPRDIFMTPDQVRVNGFGIAEALEHLGVRPPIRRPYSAPERIAGAAWAGPADVFSIAAIAYELLSGRRIPGPGTVPPFGFEGNRPEWADAIEAVLERALSENPAARYGSTATLAEAFEAALETGTAQSTPAPVQAPTPPEDAVEIAGLTPLVRPKRTRRTPRPARTVATELEPDQAAVARPGTPDSDLFEEFLESDASALSKSPPPPFASRGRTIPETQPVALAPEEVPVAVHEEAEAPEAAPIEPPPSSVPLIAPAARESSTMWAGAEVTQESTRSGLRPGAFGFAGIALALGLVAGFVAGYLVRGPGQASVTTAPGPDPGVTRASPSTPPAAPQEVTERAVPEAPPSPRPTAGSDVRAADSAPPSPAPAPGTLAKPSGPTGGGERPAGAMGTSRSGRPPAPEPGRLLVRSTPAGATVFVNGERRGDTPLTLRNLRYGTYTLRLTREGYAPVTREVRVTAGEPAASVAIDLAAVGSEEPSVAGAGAALGSIYIDSRPRGARVLIDGQLVGTTPALVSAIQPGAHAVTIEQDGYRSVSSSVQVRPRAESRVTASLEPLP